MKNNKPGFFNSLTAVVVLLLPIVFLTNWIWQVLKNGGIESVLAAGIGIVFLIRYLMTFVNVIKGKKSRKKEADPWQEDFQRRRNYEQVRQKNVKPAKNKSSDLVSIVLISLFMLAVVINDIRRTAGTNSREDIYSALFILVVLAIIITNSVKGIAQNKKDREKRFYTNLEAHSDCAENPRQIRYFTEEDWQKGTYAEKGITFYCPYCDGKLEQSFEYCPHCGNKLHK